MTIYYDKLIADAKAFVARTDISDAVAATCVQLAEAEIWKRVYTFEMETDVDLPAAELDFFEVDVPIDFLKFRRVHSNLANPRCKYTSPDIFHTFNNSTRSQREALLDDASLVYTVESGKLKASNPANSGDPIVFSTCYFRRFDFPNVTPSAETNPVLDRHYDLYLYGTVKAIWEFADEDSEIAKYEKKFDKAIAQVAEFERARRAPSAGPLVRTSTRRPLA